MELISKPKSDIHSSQVSHITELDGIRGIAAIMVMLFHLPLPLTEVPWLTPFRLIFNFGQTGVDLFFVLSGFLITRILIQSRNKEHYFSRFYIRRALRIFPLYYLFLIIFYLTYDWLIGAQPITTFGIATYSLYLQNIVPLFTDRVVGPHHYWSLAVEEHFYMIWPFIVWKCSSAGLLRVIVGCVVGAAILRGIAVSWESVSTYHFTLTRIDALAMGGALALWEVHQGIRREDFKTALTLFGLGLLTSAIIFVAGGRSAGILGEVCKFTALGVLYTGLIFTVITLPTRSAIRNLLKGRTLCWIGGISYGLYVYHQWCYRVVNTIVPDMMWPLKTILCLSLPVLVATLSFRFFESPILKLKNRIPIAH